MACSLSIMLARSRLSATGTACVPPLTSLCYPPTIIRAFCVCGPHVMRSSKTNHKPADMQQAYPEANTELVEQVSKMTSKHEKEREREEPDKRTNEKADRCVCWDVLVAHLLHGSPRARSRGLSLLIEAALDRSTSLLLPRIAHAPSFRTCSFIWVPCTMRATTLVLLTASLSLMTLDLVLHLYTKVLSQSMLGGIAEPSVPR